MTDKSNLVSDSLSYRVTIRAFKEQGLRTASLPRLLLTMLIFACSVDEVQSNQDEDWKFTLAFPMIWVTDINGTISVGDRTIDITTPFKDTLDSLSFGYMAEFYARKGPWRYALKLNYAESEDEIITPEYIIPPGIPIAPSHRVETERVEGTTDFTVGYELDNGLLLFSGMRYIFSKIDLTITPLGSGVIEIEEEFNVADEHLYDWLVGAEYQYKFAEKWTFIMNGDTSFAGDNDKDYSANVVLAYQISKLNTLWLGYRYLRIADKFTEDGTDIETDFVTYGPTIGWAFTF